MSNPFVGEIRMFAGNFAPVGHAMCSGQVMSISQNTALFSLLGTTYGGNGTSTFGLPNLLDRVPMDWGNGPGLTPRTIGELSGQSSVTLLTTEIPLHTHNFPASASAGSDSSPSNESYGVLGRGRPGAYTTTAPTVQMATTAIGGGSSPHNNRQPYLGVTFIIATQGVYPSRN